MAAITLFGNPSSAYGFCNRVGDAIAAAREQVAGLLNCDVREVIFTSCGTESNNTAFNNALLVTASSGAMTHDVPDSAGVTASFAKDTRIAEYNDLSSVEEALEQGRAMAQKLLANEVVEDFTVEVLD